MKLTVASCLLAAVAFVAQYEYANAQCSMAVVRSSRQCYKTLDTKVSTALGGDAATETKQKNYRRATNTCLQKYGCPPEADPVKKAFRQCYQQKRKAMNERLSACVKKTQPGFTMQGNNEDRQQQKAAKQRVNLRNAIAACEKKLNDDSVGAKISKCVSETVTNKKSNRKPRGDDKKTKTNKGKGKGKGNRRNNNRNKNRNNKNRNNRNRNNTNNNNRSNRRRQARQTSGLGNLGSLLGGSGGTNPLAALGGGTDLTALASKFGLGSGLDVSKLGLSGFSSLQDGFKKLNNLCSDDKGKGKCLNMVAEPCRTALCKCVNEIAEDKSVENEIKQCMKGKGIEDKLASSTSHADKLREQFPMCRAPGQKDLCDKKGGIQDSLLKLGGLGK